MPTLDAACHPRDVGPSPPLRGNVLLPPRHGPSIGHYACFNCNSRNFVYESSCSSHPGSTVCTDCGAVSREPVFFETMYGASVTYYSSNYKRIHHWHERISQLLLNESQIPNDKMLQIATKLCDGSYKSLDKESIRAVLRSLNMQIYIEKWLQIIYRITKHRPPTPGPLILQRLDDLFLELQRPFNARSVQGRKNFLNYNYVFCRLLQMMDCASFCAFFPLIKSKAKLKSLDEMWTEMVESIGWKVKPLASVPPFSVPLCSPSSALSCLCSELESQAPAEQQIGPTRKAALRLDRQRQPYLHSIPVRRQSDQPAQKFQRLVKLGARRR